MTSPRPTEAAIVAALARIMAVSSAPAELLLGLLLEALGDPHSSRSAAVLVPSDGGRTWRVGAATSGFGRDGIEALARQIGPARATVAQPADVGTSFQGFVAEPVLDGTGSAVRLVASGVQVGVLVIQHCTPEQWAALSPSVAVGLAMCLTGGVVRQTSAEATAAALRSADAFRRLLEEGAHARDVEEAGAVVARAAAEAFQTELAGMYVVDQDTGLISFALGVGVPDELSRALSRSLVGKVAAASPVWQALEAGCPSLVDDAAGAAIRPGGFVQTLGFVSYAAIPLLSADGPLGMVICGEATTRRRWTQQEHDLARQFAMRGALVIDAARLRASERRQLARITFQAYHDGLTGIANRTLFIDRAEQALGVAARTGARVAMLMLDLDDFKQVNDTLGHGYGDTLLREVASRLTRLVPEADTVARLGGDEFAILMPSSAGPAEALALARTIEAALSDPIDLGGILLNTRASIGIAVSPDDGDDATDLMQRADIAMYASKRAGRGPTRYHCSQHDFTLDKLTLYTELRRAIAEDQLKMVYQPKLDLATGVIVGAEALVRWQHPRRGLIGPNEFLPVAESTDLIGDLTAWVTERALSQLADWHEQGLVIDVAINISARNLLDPALLAHVTRLIARSRLAHHLVLEITETAVMLDPAASADALSRFRELGVRVSLDDFGAGHSSLTQLAQLPADEIKIDRMLVHDVEREPLHAALVGSVADLGHRLGLTVVAEGIETAETLQAVRQLGCDIAQGYVISRPVEPEQFGSIAGIRRGAGRRTMRREDPVGPNGSCGRSGGRVSLVRCRRTASPVAPGPALP